MSARGFDLEGRVLDGASAVLARSMGRREAVRLGAVVAASAALALSGCSGGGEGSQAVSVPDDEADPSPAPEAPAPVDEPSTGFEMTEQASPFPASWVCVTEYAGNTLAVIDAERGEIAERIGAGLNPSMMTGAAGTLYVGGSGEGSVFAVDTASGVITTIPVGNQPIGMCLDTAGAKLYVADYFDSSIRVVDAALGSVVNSVRLSAVGYHNRTDPPDCCRKTPGVGRRPVSVALSPDDEVLYAASFGTYDIARIDVPANAEIDPFDGVVGPRTITVSRDGATLLLAGVGGEEEEKVSHLYVIDRQTGARLHEIFVGVGVTDVCQSADGAVVYATARDDGDLVAFDAATWTEAGRVHLAAGIEAMSLSSDGTRLFVANAETGVLTAIDTAGLAPVFEVSGLANPKDVWAG